MAAIDSPTHSKGEAVFGSTDNGTHVSENEFKEEVGGLQFDQYLTGGLGRHLGIFSTTSLMWESSIALDVTRKLMNGMTIASDESSVPEYSLPPPQSSMASDHWAPR